MEKGILQDATVSTWVHDTNFYSYNGIKYWIHKIAIHDNWVMTNFNYELTNIDLKTVDLKTAEQRAIVMIRTKQNILIQAISTLTTFTRGLRKKSIQVSPDINRSLVDFTNKIRTYHNI